MFGQHHRPPKPPPYEPWLLLLLAVVIAGLGVVAYVAVGFLFPGL
ncbi:MAG: hypothetical protein OXI58_12775 [Gemmatimonadota bacterium]|nr:hypothetical protein [Gemmatimonadota bacterium]MDE2742457.1 hypothetical protein [Gemmatimonadota bacterium]